MALAGWRSLGVPAEELRLEHTLPTGQSFRWRQTGENEYTGVIGQRVVQMRQLEGDVAWRVLGRGRGADPAKDAGALEDYFNLGTSLTALTQRWAAACPYFAHVHQHFKGARMLRQDPVETLFQFLCSSNNHISRIQGMVERLAAAYGTEIVVEGDGDVLGLQTTFHAFPTVDQLCTATEAELRAAGFGYRARFVTGSAAMVQERGGATWLHGLRTAPAAEALSALQGLPGVGPKVAACVALFSLDAHGLVPVDVHVAALAAKRYAPRVGGKALTPDVHAEVQAAFERLFGTHAGWAHNTLFISELARFKGRVPPFKDERRKKAVVEEGSVVAAASGPKSRPRKRGRASRGVDADDAADAADGKQQHLSSEGLETKTTLGPATPPQLAE